MKALVLESRGKLSLQDFPVPDTVPAGHVKVKIHTVGICGSDVHYYRHGHIGPYVVKEPMILGHEASGTVAEIGAGVTSLRPGDRVCMEPGIPDPTSRASRMGIYNVDPNVTFWATPPVNGCLTGFVVHPASLTYKLPDSVSFAEGALVEPFSIGLQAAKKARIVAGDIGLVLGAGTIGTMVAIAALASGCSRIILADFATDKLAIASKYPGISTVDLNEMSLSKAISSATDGWGVDVVFEASGSPKAYEGVFGLVRPGGCLVLVGMPVEPVTFDVVAAAAKECRIETVFRYANVYDRAIEMIATGKVALLPLVSATYPFDQSVSAFERAAEARQGDVKLQIVLPQ